MRGINRVILLGNLGADPDKRETSNGLLVTTLNIATSEQWTDKHTGEKQEKTEWHRVVLFARLAEVAVQYLQKGSQVYIEGRLQTRKWQGQDGQDRYTTEIVANELVLLGGKGSSAGPREETSVMPQARSTPAGGGSWNNFEEPPFAPESPRMIV